MIVPQNPGISIDRVTSRSRYTDIEIRKYIVDDHGVTRVTKLIFRKDLWGWPVVVWWLVLVVVLDTLLGVGSPLAPGPRLHRFTHAGSFEAALEAIKKVSSTSIFSFFFLYSHFKFIRNIKITSNFLEEKRLMYNSIVVKYLFGAFNIPCKVRMTR